MPPTSRAPGSTIVAGDLRDAATLGRALAGVEVVYNIAALYRQAGLAGVEYRAVNAIAVGDSSSRGARAGVRRVVHCSTVGVHGDIEHPPANEDAPLRPGDVYQRTKLEGEQLAREAAARTGVELTIARPSGIYGPGDRRLFKLFRGVARGGSSMLGDGRDLLPSDLHRRSRRGLPAVRRRAARPRAAPTSSPAAEVTTLNELVAIIADGWRASGRRVSICRSGRSGWRARPARRCAAPLGIEPPLYRRRVDFFTKSRAFDITRARRELGFAPGVGLREGIRRTLAWYGAAMDLDREAAAAASDPARAGRAVRAGQSARAKYQRAHCRPPGPGALLRHEFVRCSRSRVPGALGLALRKRLYPWLLGACGRNVIFGQHVVLAASAQDPHRRQRRHRRQLPARRQGREQRGHHDRSGVFIGRNTILSCKNGDIEHRRRARTSGSTARCSPPAACGSARHAGRRVLLVDRRRPRFSESTGPCWSRAARSQGVAIGAGAWLGAGVKVLDGVHRSATARSSAQARSSAGACRRARWPSACPRAWSAAVSPPCPERMCEHRRGAVAAAERAAGLRSSRWDGSRMHGVKRLFSWMIPRFDRAVQRLARQPPEERRLGRDAR